MSRHSITIVGAGNMGTAIAELLAKNNHKVRLWDYNPETLQVIKETKANPFLPDVKLSSRILVEAEMPKAVEGAELIVIAASSPYVRSTARHLTQCLRSRLGPVIAHVAKGLEHETFLTMHEVIQEELPKSLRRKVVTLSGPSIAKEFVRGIPTALIAASQDKKAADLVRGIFTSPSFRVAVSSDVRGVGVCGALKNVYAIALGMCDGLAFTMSAKAFLCTAAISEMGGLVRAFGGKQETVYGLAGLGDIIVTGLGDGRNRALGERICKEGSCRLIFEDKGAQTFEGVTATKVIHAFVSLGGLNAPLSSLVYKVIYKAADPCEELLAFFAKCSLG